MPENHSNKFRDALQKFAEAYVFAFSLPLDEKDKGQAIHTPSQLIAAVANCILSLSIVSASSKFAVVPVLQVTGIVRPMIWAAFGSLLWLLVARIVHSEIPDWKKEVLLHLNWLTFWLAATSLIVAVIDFLIGDAERATLILVLTLPALLLGISVQLWNATLRRRRKFAYWIFLLIHCSVFATFLVGRTPSEVLTDIWPW